MIDITKHPEYDNHELVKSFSDDKTGLKGIIAIHSTVLGPAVGGTRYFHYGSEEEALDDVLRLSRGMTYKCILAGVNYGGAKCVLIAPNNDNTKSEEYLEAYGNILKDYPNFYTGEDVGMHQDDIEILSKVTPNIIGTMAKAGDPSPWAALSTYYAMRGAFRFLYNDSSLKGKKVIIKGLGKVGMELARLAYEDGAILMVHDIIEDRINIALNLYKNTTRIDPDEMFSTQCDVFAPCALGKDIDENVANTINAKVICGAANNQLVSDKEGIILFNRGIVYVPDYVANGGGLINVVAELEKDGYNKENVLNKCKKVEDEVFLILNESKESNTAPNIVADLIAKRALIK